MIFPWQESQWELLMQRKRMQRLPHAILLRGIKGLGKAILADHFVRVLLCEQRNDQCCNKCHSCRLLNKRSHPNVLWVEPEKENQAIKVDQIRDASQFINQTALLGSQQVVIINPANALNPSAANALLKTLEEPPVNSLIILLGDESSRLPSTIFSRCQRIQFNPPLQSAALHWLEKQLHQPADFALALNLAQGAPLAALKIIQSDYLILRQTLFNHLAEEKPAIFSFKFFNHLKDVDVLIWIDLLISWCIDLLNLKMNNTTKITNADYIDRLKILMRKKTSNGMANYMWQLLQLRKQVMNGINFNKQMFLENLILKWSGIR